MLNFGRRDRIAEAKHVDKSALKPALYDPPGSVARSTSANSPVRSMSSAVTSPPIGQPTPAPASTTQGVTAPAATTPRHAETPASKLLVGVNVKLKGVEISDCDVLVIEGHVEATVNSKVMEIAKPGTLKGTAFIDVAEIHGEFSGELTARIRLVVHGTGRVSGTIRYGRLIVADGGQLNGDIKQLNDADESTQASRVSSSAGSVLPAPASNVGTH